MEKPQEFNEQSYIDENSDVLFNRLIFNPLLRIGGLAVLLVFSIIFNDRIVRLTRITSNAIFSNEIILGPVTYYTILGATILLCAVVSFGAICVKPDEGKATINLLRKTYTFYTIYDMVVFVMSTFVCLFFIVMILITPCNISGDSMNDTYQDGDRVFIWNIGYSPVVNDVVVFDASNYVYGNDQFFIKRVVAKEKDQLSYQSGNLLINGVNTADIDTAEYKILTGGADPLDSYTIPKGKILVLGDNRDVSYDSRRFGLVDEKDVVGKVLFRFFPFNKIGNPAPVIK